MSVLILYDLKSIDVQFLYGTGYGKDEVVLIDAVIGTASFVPKGDGFALPVYCQTPPVIEPALRSATLIESSLPPANASNVTQTVSEDVQV